MPENLWTVINVRNRSGSPVEIRDARVMWGKFHKNGNKSEEIGAGSICQVVPAGGSVEISSCGRSDSASGVEGEFKLYEGDTLVRSVYWSCPWGSKVNTLTISGTNEAWLVQSQGGSFDSGALGNITLTMVKM